MSADNYAVIAQHPETGRWHVLQGFASEDEFTPTVYPSPWHLTEDHAMRFAESDYFEYGYSTGDWPDVWFEPTTCPTCHDYTMIVERRRAT